MFAEPDIAVRTNLHIIWRRLHLLLAEHGTVGGHAADFWRDSRAISEPKVTIWSGHEFLDALHGGSGSKGCDRSARRDSTDFAAKAEPKVSVLPQYDVRGFFGSDSCRKACRQPRWSDIAHIDWVWCVFIVTSEPNVVIQNCAKLYCGVDAAACRRSKVLNVAAVVDRANRSVACSRSKPNAAI